MKKYLVASSIALLLLVGCSQAPIKNVPSKIEERAALYIPLIEKAAAKHHVDKLLMMAISEVESGFNPNAVSASNAIGLMQIKASTAGHDVYKQRGKWGTPSTSTLKDPKHNVDIGGEYLQILQTKQLAGITDPMVLRYATIVSYSNGAGALLRTFHPNKKTAIKLINNLDAAQFAWHVKAKHPAAQAPRYLWKVRQAYARYEAKESAQVK